MLHSRLEHKHSSLPSFGKHAFRYLLQFLLSMLRELRRLLVRELGRAIVGWLRCLHLLARCVQIADESMETSQLVCAKREDK